SVLLNAATIKGLAIWPVNVKADLLLPTSIKELKGKTKGFSLALSVKLRVISKLPKAKERESRESGWEW
ncbi:hypothetical protein Tco_0614202, partial [Tanacetum coccineum]